MYFLIQQIASLVADAAAPRPARFDPRPRLQQDLQRLLVDVPDDDLPAELREALRSGAVVGPYAADWLPKVRDWLTRECARNDN